MAAGVPHKGRRQLSREGGGGGVVGGGGGGGGREAPSRCTIEKVVTKSLHRSERGPRYGKKRQRYLGKNSQQQLST